MVKHLLIINVLMYLAAITLTRFHIDLTEYLGLHFFKASHFQPYQLITYMFMHANFGHLFFNMFALWMFGNTLENIWGSKRFLLFYMVCGIGAGLCQELVQYIQYSTSLANYATVNMGGHIVTMDAYLNMMNTVGASGAIYGLLLAFGMMFPNSPIYIYFLFPIKAKWFVLLYGGIELLYGVMGTSDGVAHFAHLGGMLFGILLILLWRRNNRKGNDEQVFYKVSRSDHKQDWKWPFSKKEQQSSKYYVSRESGRPLTDEEFNTNRQTEKKRVDEILDKISQKGYEALSAEEKEFLFHYSKK